jgi:hypothetical protein
MGSATRLLVLDSDRAIDLSQVELTPGGDPAVILRNAMKAVESLASYGRLTGPHVVSGVITPCTSASLFYVTVVMQRSRY